MTDVVVVEAVRTPFGRDGGALAQVRPDDLAAVVLRALVVLGALRPAFREGGMVTAGSSSGINDGAAAVLLGQGIAMIIERA